MTSACRIGAIYKREIRSYFDSPIAYVFLVVFLMLLGFLTFSISRYYENGQADPRWFFFWHPWVYLILVPAAAMRLWAEERRSGTLELLLTLPVTLAETLAGKFLAAWTFLAIALALTFPIILTTLYLGDPDMGVFVSGYLGSFLLAGAYLSVGLLTSAMTRNQVVSFVLAVVISLFLILSGWPPVTDVLVQWGAPGWLVKTVAAFSFMPHFEASQQGVVDLRDLLYYASVMVFMLSAAHVVIENRKAA